MYLSSFVWHDIVLLGGHWFIQMPWPRQFSKNKLGPLILFSKWLLTKKVTKSWFCTGTTWGEMDTSPAFDTQILSYQATRLSFPFWRTVTSKGPGSTLPDCCLKLQVWIFNPEFWVWFWIFEFKYPVLSLCSGDSFCREICKNLQFPAYQKTDPIESWAHPQKYLVFEGNTCYRFRPPRKHMQKINLYRMGCPRLSLVFFLGESKSPLTWEHHSVHVVDLPDLGLL